VQVILADLRLVSSIMARRRLEAAIQAGKAIQRGLLLLCSVLLIKHNSDSD